MHSHVDVNKCVREHSIHAHPAQAQPIPRSVGQHHVASSPCGKRTRSKFPVVTQWSVAGAARQFLCRSTRSAPVATMRGFDKRAFHKSGCHRRSAENALSVCVSCDGGSRLAPPCICLQAHGLVDVCPSTSRRKSPLGFDATWTTDSTNARSTMRRKCSCNFDSAQQLQRPATTQPLGARENAHSVCLHSLAKQDQRVARERVPIATHRRRLLSAVPHRTTSVHLARSPSR